MVGIDNNPYAGIDWESIGQFKYQYHAHVRDFYDEVAELIDFYAGDGVDSNGIALHEGDEYELPAPSWNSGPNCPYWPWDNLSQYDCWGENRDATEVGDGVVALPSTEVGPTNHVNALFGYGRDDDYGEHVDIENLEELVEYLVDDEEYTEVDGSDETPLVIPAHPQRYYLESSSSTHADEGLEMYLEIFEKHSLEDGLIGIEALTKEWDDHRDFQGEEFATRWGNVELTGLIMDEIRRPLWVFGADDPNDGELGFDMDRRWTTVLLDPSDYDPDNQASSRRAIYDAIKNGHLFASQRVKWDPDTDQPADVPEIESVVVDESSETITIETDGQVRWINAQFGVDMGDEIETGETFNWGEHENVVSGRHIFPHVTTGNPDGETLLQPFTFDGEQIDIPKVTLGDVSIGDALF